MLARAWDRRIPWGLSYELLWGGCLSLGDVAALFRTGAYGWEWEWETGEDYQWWWFSEKGGTNDGLGMGRLDH